MVCDAAVTVAGVCGSDCNISRTMGSASGLCFATSARLWPTVATLSAGMCMILLRCVSVGASWEVSALPTWAMTLAKVVMLTVASCGVFWRTWARVSFKTTAASGALSLMMVLSLCSSVSVFSV